MIHHSSLVDRESSATHANRAVSTGHPSNRGAAVPEDRLAPTDAAAVTASSEEPDAAVVAWGARRRAGVLS